MPSKIFFIESEIDQLYDLSIQFKNNSINQEELIDKINNLRGGSYVEMAVALGIIGIILILLTNAWTTPNANRIVAPHLQWLYGDPKPGNQFGYGKSVGPRSITVTGVMTQDAGSDKKQPSSGSYDYIDVMRKLNTRSKIISI